MKMMDIPAIMVDLLLQIIDKIGLSLSKTDILYKKKVYNFSLYLQKYYKTMQSI
jgi:hypothetical protein